MNKLYWHDLYLKKKQAAIIKLGGRCVKCGSTDKLEFDHIDPELKSFTITGFIRQNVGEELKKCQLLCRSCHKAKTATTHGRRRMYQNGCRCEECKEVNSFYMK